MGRIAILLATALAGCAFGDGGHFAELSARLEAELDRPADRDAGGGFQTLASEFEVELTRFELELVEVQLLDTGGALSFDPANPPPGYSLCHNGHCHADDGRLVSYEDIAAELAQGGGSAPVVVLPVGLLDLLAGESRALACEPECGLPRADIGVALAPIAAIAMAGVVRDGRDPARIAETIWEFEATPAEGEARSLDARLDLPADREHAPDVELTVSLAPTVGVLDAVDFAALPAGAGGYDLAADAVARARVFEGFGELLLSAEVNR
jgi:hypothetical protein